MSIACEPPFATALSATWAEPIPTLGTCGHSPLGTCILPLTVLRSSVLVALGLCSCSALVPVPRHPWLEDRTLALHEQSLRIDVQEQTVSVDARLSFRELNGPRARTVSFAVAGPRGAARHFCAQLEHGDGRRTELVATKAKPSPLPQGQLAEAFDIELPPAVGPFVLHVRYRQPGRGPFQYALLTGAYWSGPIERLTVVVRDPEARVIQARLEGVPPRITEAGFEWVLNDIEPQGALQLALR